MNRRPAGRFLLPALGAVVVAALSIATAAEGGDPPVANLAARLRSHIDSLVSAGGHRSRVVFTAGNESAVDYILRRMRRDVPDARLDTFTVPRRSTRAAGELANVVAFVPGSSDSLIVVCAHLDASASRDPGWSRSWSTAQAPGAVDNATGVAALLEILTLVRHAAHPPRYSILFVACNAEERNPDYRGLSGELGHHIGSRHVAGRLREEGREVKGVIALDMVGFNPTRPGVGLFATGRSTRLARELRDLAVTLRLRLELPSRFEPCSRSDNEAFDRYGFPSILFMESCAPWRNTPGQPRNPGYHTSRDLPNLVNHAVLDGVTRLVTAYLLQ